MGWPSIRTRAGLGSNVSSCDGPPAIVSQMTRFAFGGNARAGSDPPGGCAWAPRSEGPSSEASATAPTPCVARAEERPAVDRKCRRVQSFSSFQDLVIISWRLSSTRATCVQAASSAASSPSGVGRHRSRQGAGGVRVRPVTGQVLVEQLARPSRPRTAEGRAAAQVARPGSSGPRAGPALAEHPRGEGAGRLDVGRII